MKLLISVKSVGTGLLVGWCQRGSAEFWPVLRHMVQNKWTKKIERATKSRRFA